MGICVRLGECEYMLTMKLNRNDEYHGSVVYRSTRHIQFPVCESREEQDELFEEWDVGC